MLGVAIGTGIPVVLANLFILLPAACRQAGMGVAEFLRQVAIAPLAGAVPATAAVLAFRRLLPPESIGAILAEGAVVGLVYLTSVYAFGLDVFVRARYFEYARRLVAALPARRLRTAQA
jgi:hypothetical protein